MSDYRVIYEGEGYKVEGIYQGMQGYRVSKDGKEIYWGFNGGDVCRIVKHDIF